MAENKSMENNMIESLWEVCFKALGFLDELDRLALDLSTASVKKNELAKAFEPLMKEEKFLSRIAQAHMKNHRWKEALEAYRGLNQDSLEVIRDMGEIFLNLKDYKAASEQFTRLLKIDQDSSVAWFKRAQANYLMGTDLENSVFYLERALELDPDYIDALMLMSKTWIERSGKKTDQFVKGRMYQEALRCLDLAQKQSQNQKSPMKEFNLARVEALRSKADPMNEEAHLEKLANYLQEAVEKDSSGKLKIKEMVNNERCFADLGIEFVEVSEESSENEPPSVPDIRENISEDHPRQQGGDNSSSKYTVPQKIGMVTPEDLYGEAN